jgi:hypothetical protein
MAAVALESQSAGSAEMFDLLDRLTDLRHRRAAREIDDPGYLDELHLLLLWHRL